MTAETSVPLKPFGPGGLRMLLNDSVETLLFLLFSPKAIGIIAEQQNLGLVLFKSPFSLSDFPG